MPSDVAEVHEAEWRRWFGPYDEVAGYRPAQAERLGFAILLLAEGRPRGFVKARPGWEPEREVEACRRAQGAETFWAPDVAGVHWFAGWTSVGTTALPPGLHSPSVPSPVGAISDEVSELLGDDLGGKRPDWQPMHGDMGPWNLRHLKGRRPALIDWEHVGYAPPHADLVFHEAASRAVGLKASTEIGSFVEARMFWEAEIQARFGSGSRDVRLARDMLRVLSAYR
jgi:hypothetical protein